MSKTILAEVDGFTPVIDRLAQECGAITALVFGRVWRYCQMKDGVCNASLETIASGIGMSPWTVERHIKTLVKAGYLEDLTPTLRKHPHTYKDTGKVALIGRISTVDCASDLDVQNANLDVQLAPDGCANSQLKKVLRKTIKKSFFSSFENQEPFDKWDKHFVPIPRK
jgi:hypothetical protein